MKKIFLCLCLCLLLPHWSWSNEKKIKVACLGNSITYGAGIPNRFQHSYPSILQQMLGEGYDVRNFGVSGSTMLNKGDMPYMLESAYRKALKFNPDIVTVKLGTNDSKAFNWKYKKDFAKDLCGLIEELSALPSAPKIYLCLPAPAFKGNYHIDDSTITHEVIPLIRKVAKKKHLEIIDLNTPLQDDADLFPDNIHPNKYGALVLAEEIYEALKGEKAPRYDVDQAFPGKKSEWKGFDRYDFFLNGNPAAIIAPQKAAHGRPWIWHSAPADEATPVEEDLLQRGFHVVYYDLSHQPGSPWFKISAGREFHSALTAHYKLSQKVVLKVSEKEDSFVYNWAAANTDKVSCILADGQAISSTALQEKMGRLCAGRIPLAFTYGHEERSAAAAALSSYRRLGGVAEMILKPADEAVSDFIVRYGAGYTDAQYIHFRKKLTNAFSRFTREKEGCVAFLGGSITEMRGWKEQVAEDLRQRFPETRFTFIDAGISSTGTVPHAFRMSHDIFEKGIPDLLFVEAAVNDDINIPDDKDQHVRGMEGIIRHALTENPYMDIVMMHFIWDGFIRPLKEGIIPDVIMNHERVANAYGVTSIDLAHEISDRMRSGEFDWKTFGGTHPHWNGHKYYTAAINRVFDWSTAAEQDLVRTPRRLPVKQLDPYSYCTGRFLDIRKAEKTRGFSIAENWTPEVKKSTRKGFVHVPMLTGLEAGASFELEFTGKAIGYFGVCGPQSGTLAYSIDGKPYKPLDTFTKWSRGLYIPWVYILADQLSEGRHVLKVEMAPGEKTACHIRNFLVLDE